MSRRRHRPGPRQFGLAAVLALLVGLAAAPQAAIADDASLKRVVLGEVGDLVKADAKVARALRALDGAKSARRARGAVHAARVEARRLARKAKRERPSSQNGEIAQNKLLRSLKTEDRALAKLSAGLRARLAGERARARSLIARGERGLRRAAEQGARAGDLIQALPHR